MASKPIQIVILAYDGVQTLDLAGPLDAFASAKAILAEAYLTRIASLDGAPVVSESGLRMLPDGSLGSMGAFDTLIVPGGASLRSTRTSAAPYCRWIVSVCTGIYGIASTGMLDGLRVTTHWRFADDLCARFPALQLDCDKVFIKQGRMYTSAGITAAIDLSLSLIEEDYGPELALRQFSEPLRFQARSGARFLQAFGQPASEKVESLRLDAARDHLSGSAAPIDAVARVVGFRSHDAFSRAFDRRFGVSPSEYRRCFSPSAIYGSEAQQ